MSAEVEATMAAVDDDGDDDGEGFGDESMVR
jgi:hypothetical protein